MTAKIAAPVISAKISHKSHCTVLPNYNARHPPALPELR